jgi:hypothetical protein
MSNLYVDSITEKTSGNGVHIPGHVIQVVNGTFAVETNYNSNVFIDTGLFVSITPKYANSLIHVHVDMSGIGSLGTNPSLYAVVQVLRESTVVATGNVIAYENVVSYRTDTYSTTVLDNPNSTSTIIYKVQIRASQASQDIRWGWNQATNSITLMEIAQ